MFSFRILLAASLLEGMVWMPTSFTIHKGEMWGIFSVHEPTRVAYVWSDKRIAAEKIPLPPDRLGLAVLSIDGDHQWIRVQHGMDSRVLVRRHDSLGPWRHVMMNHTAQRGRAFGGKYYCSGARGGTFEAPLFNVTEISADGKTREWSAATPMNGSGPVAWISRRHSVQYLTASGRLREIRLPLELRDDGSSSSAQPYVIAVVGDVAYVTKNSQIHEVKSDQTWRRVPGSTQLGLYALPDGKRLWMLTGEQSRPSLTLYSGKSVRSIELKKLPTTWSGHLIKYHDGVIIVRYRLERVIVEAVSDDFEYQVLFDRDTDSTVAWYTPTFDGRRVWFWSPRGRLYSSDPVR